MWKKSKPSNNAVVSRMLDRLAKIAELAEQYAQLLPTVRREGESDEEFLQRQSEQQKLAERITGFSKNGAHQDFCKSRNSHNSTQGAH